jgi:carboxymethylenebutenolidase
VVDGQTVEVTTADGPMPVYEAVPDGPARGAVIVVQEAFGVNDHIEDVTRRFATAGYHAVAPHLFHRAGGGTASYEDFNQVIPLFEGLTDEGILMDIDAAREILAAAGFTDAQTGIVGFCFGGRTTFLVALRRRLGAASGFYGGGLVKRRFPQFPELAGEAASLQTPWLGLFGDEDASIPIEEVEELREALVASPVPTEIVRYPGAEHGFHCDVRASYDAEAAADAWSRTLIWFDAHLEAK